MLQNGRSIYSILEPMVILARPYKGYHLIHEIIWLVHISILLKGNFVVKQNTLGLNMGYPVIYIYIN